MTDIIVVVVVIILSTITTLIFVKSVGNFTEKYPTVNVLTLSFLVMIGCLRQHYFSLTTGEVFDRQRGLITSRK